MRTHNIYPNFKIFFGITLVLNIIWEFAHAPLYISSFTGSAPPLMVLMLAAVLDAIIILFLFLFAQRFRFAPEKFILISAIFLAIIIELTALQLGLWSYKNTMPIIPLLQIGLTPTIQLAITGVFSLRIAKLFVA